MKFLITESQFKNLTNINVPFNVRRKIPSFEEYLNYTLNYLSLYRNRFSNFEQFLETVIEELVDRLYHGWFSEMDDTSDEWKQSAKFIKEYVLGKFYDKIELFYHFNIK